VIGDLGTAWVAKEEMIAASTILEVLSYHRLRQEGNTRPSEAQPTHHQAAGLKAHGKTGFSN
jgi:hypothetical protein